MYLKAMDRTRFAFALVGVAAARRQGEVRVALAGAAPIPWLLGSPGRPRPGDAAARHRLQGRPRAPADPARTRRRRLMVWSPVVLAAGASSRFGSPNSDCCWSLCSSGCARAGSTAWSLSRARTRSSRRRADGRLSDWERGAGTSLRCGLAALPDEAEAAVVVLGDGPDLEPRAIDRVIERWRAGRDPVVAASYGGTRLHRSCSTARIWPEIPDEGARTSTPSSSPATI